MCIRDRYSNSLAAMAREKGLQPMAFNDGFYYGDEDDVAFDKDVLISYWSKGCLLYTSRCV